MTMLEILKSRLPDDLRIVAHKEAVSKYKISFEYEGTQTTTELPKTCLPGCQNEVADYIVRTAMSTILMKKGDYKRAKAWLDGVS